MPPRLLLLLSLTLALAAMAAPAGAADYVPGEVIVRYADGGAATRVDVEDGKSVDEAVSELRRDPKVDYAVPNYVARASQFTPNDPRLRLQWNLIGAFGIRMREAWALAEAAGAPGGRGVTVAV